MVRPSPRLLVLLLPLLTTACRGAVQGRPTTPGERQVVEMEAMRITACADDDPACEAQSYDASQLFEQATALLNDKQCPEAVELYDRLAREFPDSRYASPALYNAGLCLQASADWAGSAERYALLRERYPESEDRRDASFQLAEVLVQLERWDELMAVADELLAREDLSADERLEAMARRGQGLLGKERFEEAERHARSSLSYYRTRGDGDAIKDDFFAAACNYVLAETFRERAQRLDFPQGIEAQKQVLIRRAELLLEAQREYFNTISLNNLDNYHWAAASGYRIGNMYDELWTAIMQAPVPPHLPAEGHAVYRQELAKLVKPLIRHAIRYWEMTLMFIERTGIRTQWADKTRSDLERVRSLLLEQPPGPGGLDAHPDAGATPAGES
ncbi:MAG: tetratricopeptide repeat protein [Myxococcales bacterium]|jgi:tetratricopeptide (TPR) repeat protein